MAGRRTAARTEEWWEMIAPPSAVRCDAHVQSGERCRREAIVGTTVCRQHGGAAPQVRARAAARIGNAADEMVKRLFAMLDDPETPHAVSVKVMQDLLDRAGLNATEKHLVGVGPADKVEQLFAGLLADPANFNTSTPVVLPPNPQIEAYDRVADAEVYDEVYGDDIVDAEVVEEPFEPISRPAEAVSARPPAHIRRALERLI